MLVAKTISQGKKFLDGLAGVHVKVNTSYDASILPVSRNTQRTIPRLTACEIPGRGIVAVENPASKEGLSDSDIDKAAIANLQGTFAIDRETSVNFCC